MTCKLGTLLNYSHNSDSSSSDDSWHLFMKRFAKSVQHITGQELDVKAASDGDSAHLVELEIEALRAKVNELSDEVSAMFLDIFN